MLLFFYLKSSCLGQDKCYVSAAGRSHKGYVENIFFFQIPIFQDSAQTGDSDVHLNGNYVDFILFTVHLRENRNR